MKPPPISQGNNGQFNGPPNSSHQNGYGLQKPVKKVGSEQESLDHLVVVAINGDADEEGSLTPVTHLRSPGANGSEPALINGSHQPPISNMQAVDAGSVTATTATVSISAPPPPLIAALSSPTTPTPSSMSSFHQRRYPTQLDLTSDQASLDVPSSVQSPESSSNSNTPRTSSAALLSSSGGSKEEEGIDRGEGKKEDGGSHHRGTSIIIPDSSKTLGGRLSTIDPSALSSNSTNPTSSSTTTTTSRPTSTSIDSTLFSNRPAPPSPALSRRVSGAPSLGSTSSTHSRSRSRSSLSMSRANSMRMSGVGSDAKRQSLGTQLNQFMTAGATGDREAVSTTPTKPPMASSSPLGSPQKLTFTLNSQSQVNNAQTSPAQPVSASTSSTHSPLASITPSIVPDPSDPTTPVPIPAPTTPSQPSSIPPPAPAMALPATPSVYIRIRDFGFASTDERHLGLGTDVPKANRVHRLNRKLGGPDRARARAAAAAAIAALDPSSAWSGRSRPGSSRTDSIGSMASVDSSDADAEAEEDEGDDVGWGMGGWGKGGGKGGGGMGWDGFRMGMGRFSWTLGSSQSNIRNGASDNGNKSKVTPNTIGTFPSRKDLDMNFMDSASSSSDDEQRQGQGRGHAEKGFTEEFPGYDDDDDDDNDFDDTRRHPEDEDEYADAEDGGEEEQPLYPGLYRAVYAFEPEGAAEMKLDEDQIIRVVGRGGGAGWAVVIDERGSSGSSTNSSSHSSGTMGDGAAAGRTPLKHALVPESYLEAVRLDWEEEEEEEEAAAAAVEDGDVGVDAAAAKARVT